MLCRLLEGRCDVTVEAEDGVVAVENMKMSIAKNCPFDLVLMDYQMPNMDGPTAARHMREMGFTGPIIGVTGNAQEADITHYIANGAEKVLIKPVDITVLEQTIS
eukprot:gene61858-biopygen30522